MAGNPVHAGCVTRVHHPTAEISALEGNVCRVRVRFSYLCPTVCLYTRCLAFVIVSRRTRASLPRRTSRPYLFRSIPRRDSATHSTLSVSLFSFSRIFFQNPSFRCRFEREKFHRVIFKFLPLPLARTCLEVLFINSYKWSILLLLIYIHIRRNIFYCSYKLPRV